MEDRPADSEVLPDGVLHPSCDPPCAPHGTEDTSVGKTMHVDTSEPKRDSEVTDSECDGFGITVGNLPH